MVGHRDLHRMLVESLHDRAVLTLDPDGRVSSWNPGAERMKGYGAGEILGQHFSIFFPPSPDGPKPEDLLRQAERDGRAEVTGWRVRKDGTRFWAQALISPMRDEGGRLLGFSKVTQDRTELLAAETAARKEQDFNRALLDTVSALVVVLDRGGRVVRFNRTCESLTGYTSAEVVGRTLWALVIPPEQRTGVQSVFQDLVEGRFPNTFENDWQARDGRILHVRWSNTALLDDRGEVEFVVATGQDVTDLRRAEEAERSSREELAAQRATLALQKALQVAVERHDLISRATNDIIWDWDLSSGRVVWNDALSRTAGYAREEVPVSVDWWEDRVHPDDRPGVLESVARALEGDDSDWAGQYRFRRADGEFLHVLDRGFIVRDPEGVPTRMVGSMLDLTPRLQAEEDLHRSNQLLMERMKELRCLMLSSRVLHQAGEELAPALQAVVDLLPEGMQFPDQAAARLRLEDREFVSRPFPETGPRLEVPIRETGRLEVAYETQAPFLEEERELLGTVADRVAEALERAEALRSLRLLHADLERRVEERTRELEAFAYSVSHDLRAPLRSLDGFSLALLEDYAEALPAQAADYLRRIRAASQRMGALIDDLLVLSRVTRADMDPEPLDLTALVEEIVAERRAAEPHRQVEAVVAPGLRAVGDRRLVRVALVNLLDNAWKFTSGRATARIEVGCEGGAFFVRDDGVGFDMAWAGRLFTPFQRLHGVKEFPGTGVGLATVQRVVGRHGGRVWAEAAPDRGATFYFELGGPR